MPLPKILLKHQALINFPVNLSYEKVGITRRY